MKFMQSNATGFNAFPGRGAFLSAMEDQHYPRGLILSGKEDKKYNPLHHRKAPRLIYKEGREGRRKEKGGEEKSSQSPQPGLRTAHSQPTRATKYWSHTQKCKNRGNSQLQKCQVSIAIKRPLLTLLSNIVLEYCRSLWVVSVEAVEDGINVSRPCLALVKSDTHFALYNISSAFAR